MKLVKVSINYLEGFARFSVAAVAANTFTGLALVTRHIVDEKQAVKAAIMPSLTDIILTRYNTTIEVTGIKQARTVPNTAVTRRMPTSE